MKSEADKSSTNLGDGEEEIGDDEVVAAWQTGFPVVTIRLVDKFGKAGSVVVDTADGDLCAVRIFELYALLGGATNVL